MSDESFECVPRVHPLSWRQRRQRRNAAAARMAARLAELYAELPGAMASVKEARSNFIPWKNSEWESVRRDTEARLKDAETELDAILKEMGSLEQFLDRREASRFRWIGVLTSGAIGGAVASFLIQMLLRIWFSVT